MLNKGGSANIGLPAFHGQNAFNPGMVREHGGMRSLERAEFEDVLGFRRERMEVLDSFIANRADVSAVIDTIDAETEYPRPQLCELRPERLGMQAGKMIGLSKNARGKLA